MVSRYDAEPPRAFAIYVPLTMENCGSKYEVDLPKQRFLRLEGVANVQGIASLPVKQLERKLGELPKDVFDEIKRAVAFAMDIG